MPLSYHTNHYFVVGKCVYSATVPFCILTLYLGCGRSRNKNDRLPIPIFNFGGEGGIRTLDAGEGILAFQASALSHYATSP
jgi:hypothetical protein